MLASSKYFSTLLGKHRLLVILSFSIVIVITTLMYKYASTQSHKNHKLWKSTQELWLVQTIRENRERQNTSGINPVVTLMYQHAPMEPSNNEGSLIPTISEICSITHNVQTIRERKNTSDINPARHVVDEFLEIKTFNPSICPTKNISERLALIIVDSGREHFRERQLIRATWGSLRKYKDWHVRILYLMGQSDYCLNPSGSAEKETEEGIEEQKLMEEHRKHGDIVIGSFADTYRNLTYKHLMGYKFALENCPEADLIIKTDDDMFVDILAILDLRTKELTNPSEKLFDIYCHYYHDEPTRCQDCGNGKWFSTLEEWPEDTYPLYCLGNDYAISMEWVEKIYSVRALGGFFWVDDVFIMGKLREIAQNSYKEKTKMMNIKRQVTDKRGSGYVIDNCHKETVNFGLFVFLIRDSWNFETEVECLWRKSFQRAKVNIGLVVINDY